MIDYEWEAGEWNYSEMVDEYKIQVPQPDGTFADIQQHPVNHCEKTLGIYTCPAGSGDKQIEVLIDKVATWTTRLENGTLPAKWGWVSYFQQLWPKLNYGLGTNPSQVKELQALEEPKGELRQLYRRLLPKLGVNRNIKAGWRHLHPTFGGVGIRTLLTEVVIARVNLLMQHYGTNSSIGTQLTTSLELLQLETGYNDNPLNHPFHPMGPLCTPCWFRSLWEAVDHFKFRIVLDYPTQQEPRENDTLLISLFNAWTNEMQSRRSLNRCRIVWNAIFLSDVATANGRQVEHHMTQPPTSRAPPVNIRLPRAKTDCNRLGGLEKVLGRIYSSRPHLPQTPRRLDTHNPQGMGMVLQRDGVSR